MSAREINYSTTEKEAFAIQFGTQHFRMYLLGRKFTIITNHNPLSWLQSMEPKGRVARWLMDLQEFDFEVKHRPGRVHNNCDGLSRLPVKHAPEVIQQSQFDTIKSCAVTLNPAINIRDAQQADSRRDSSTRHRQKPFAPSLRHCYSAHTYHYMC